MKIQRGSARESLAFAAQTYYEHCQWRRLGDLLLLRVDLFATTLVVQPWVLSRETSKQTHAALAMLLPCLGGASILPT